LLEYNYTKLINFDDLKYKNYREYVFAKTIIFELFNLNCFLSK